MRYTPGRFGSEAISSRASNTLEAPESVLTELIESDSGRDVTAGEMFGDRFEKAFEHRCGQASGVGVVTAAVIAVEQAYIAAEAVLGAVRKRVVLCLFPECA